MNDNKNSSVRFDKLAALLASQAAGITGIKAGTLSIAFEGMAFQSLDQQGLANLQPLGGTQGNAGTAGGVGTTTIIPNYGFAGTGMYGCELDVVATEADAGNHNAASAAWKLGLYIRVDGTGAHFVGSAITGAAATVADGALQAPTVTVTPAGALINVIGNSLANAPAMNWSATIRVLTFVTL